MAPVRRRISREEAARLYPDQWVVFSDPRLDADTEAFLDGFVLFHCTDQREAYRRSASLDGDLATFYTGSIPYRAVRLFANDASHKKAA